MNFNTRFAHQCPFAAIAVLLSLTASSSAAPPAMMQAAVIKSGSIEIQVEPVPVPGAGQVRIKVHAIGVNPVDWKRAVKENEGMIPGRDLAGVIDAVGSDSGEWKDGDEVIGFAVSGSGSYAEYAIASASAIAKKPANLSFEEAAGLPVAAETAWRAMVTVGNVQKDQKVLIHGGAGGVGSAAIQVAKAKGAHVIATASTRNHDYLKSLGADETIDYNTTRFEDVVKDVDLVLNTSNPETTRRSIGIVRTGGTLVSIVGAPPADACKAAGIRGAVTGSASGEMLPHVVELVEAGKLRVFISQKLPLTEAAKAWELSRSGHTRGKIILVVVPGMSHEE